MTISRRTAIFGALGAAIITPLIKSTPAKADECRFDLRVVKDHITTCGCLGPEYSGRNLYILWDMEFPVQTNGNGTLIARSLSIGHCVSNVDLARLLVSDMIARGHNAIAFYSVTNEVLRYDTIKISDRT